MTAIPPLRPSPIAGLWYSDDSACLSAQIDAYLQSAEIPPLEGEALGVIAPHAGYRYSGRTAGHAYRAVQGKTVDLVVVLAPLHAYPTRRAPFLTSAHAAYATPLGAVEIDRAALDALDAALQEQSLPALAAIAFDEEHSLEIQLPFLQRALAAPFRLLPVMLRAQHPAQIEAFGHALAGVLAGRCALIVASTDLSHFYPQHTAQQLDEHMLAQFADFSPEGALEAERSGAGYACGVAAVAAALWSTRDLGANCVKILHHSTSAEETGDTSSVVGYAAAAILKNP